MFHFSIRNQSFCHRYCKYLQQFDVDLQGKMAETMSKCAGVLHSPMSSKKRENLAKSLVTSISAVLIPGGDEGQKSSEDSTEDEVNAVSKDTHCSFHNCPTNFKGEERN